MKPLFFDAFQYFFPRLSTKNFFNWLHALVSSIILKEQHSHTLEVHMYVMILTH